jgi:hypothetical protein
VGRRLVGDDADRRGHPQQLWHQVGRVAQQPDRQRPACLCGRHGPPDRVVDIAGLLVQVAVLDPAADPRRVTVDANDDAAIHGHRQRLGSAHPAEAGRQRDGAGQRAAEPLGGHGGERLVRALQDALGADVDPRPCGHLTEHGEPGGLQPSELLPGGPLRHQVGVRDQNPRRPLVRAEDADRLARLNQQRLVPREVPKRGHDGVESRPAARRATRAAVDDELVGMLGHLGIEVVHEHPHGRFLRPPLAAEGRAARRADRSRADHP